MAGRSVLNNIGRACRFARRNGLLSLCRKAAERRGRDLAEKDYDGWLKSQLPDAEVTKRQEEAVFSYAPLISILVPAYETDEKFFREMASSVLGQSYLNVELCVADASSSGCVEEAALDIASVDSRLKYRRLSENGGISNNTNVCLEMASGDYVGLLDHDDFLLPGALYEIVGALNSYAAKEGDGAASEDRGAYPDAVYSDEDKYDTDTGRHFQPHFKPDFSLETLRSNNYICHFFMVKRRTAVEAGGFCPELDGSQDHDFIFRCTEHANSVLHVPKVLYSWRASKNSTATNPESKLYAYEAGKRAVAAHLERMGEPGYVVDTENYGFYRVVYPGQMKSPGKGREKFDRQNKVEVVYYGEVCNNSVTISGVEKYILFSPFKRMKVGTGFLDELISCAERPGCGIACAAVYDSDGKFMDNLAQKGLDDPFSGGTKGLPRGFTGYFHTVALQQELARPTSCFLIKRSVLDGLSAGGAVDVEELTERIAASGRHIFYEPGAVVYG